MYYFLRTSPRVTFRMRAVLFGVKGKGMGISGYSIPPLEKHRATGKNVYTHILFCLCVCFVWERIEKLEQKREKKKRREKPAREPKEQWSMEHSMEQWSPACLAPGTSFMEDNFSMNWLGMVLGWFKCIIFIVHFISIIITSAPPQIVRRQIPEVGGACRRGQRPVKNIQGKDGWKDFSE